MNGISNEDGGIRPDESFAGPFTARIENRRFVFDRDVDEVIRLFERVFHKETNRKLWEWKYRPPWTDETYAWVATVGDRIIGHFGAVPLRGQIKGEETLFFQFGDVMADPDSRSWNIYQRVILAKVAGDLRRQHPTAVVYGFTGEQLGLWYSWFTSQGRSTFVERADDRILRLPPDDELEDRASRIDIREWEWDAPELDELWRQQKDNIRVGLVRDRAYLQWRYAKHPLYAYSLFGAYVGDSPVGWLVTSKRELLGDWESEVRIQDLLLPPEITWPALRQAASVLRAKSLVLWSSRGAVQESRMVISPERRHQRGRRRCRASGVRMKFCSRDDSLSVHVKKYDTLGSGEFSDSERLRPPGGPGSPVVILTSYSPATGPISEEMRYSPSKMRPAVAGPSLVDVGVKKICPAARSSPFSVTRP